MKFEIDFYPGTPEAAIIGEAIVKLGAIRTGQKDQDVATPGETSITEVKVETAAPAKRPRRTQKPAELAAPFHAPALTAVDETPTTADVYTTVAASLGMTDVANTPPELLASAAPAQVAPKVWAKNEIEDMVRAKARSDFPAMQGLLTQYGVARFGALDAAKHQEFAAKLAAL